ncbi:MAG: hypothetical protein AAFR11_10010 [Pseudomonadota bacterium]
MDDKESEFPALTAGLLARKGQATPAMDGFTHARFGLPEEERARLERGMTPRKQGRSVPEASDREIELPEPDLSAYADDGDFDDEYEDDYEDGPGFETPALLREDADDVEPMTVERDEDDDEEPPEEPVLQRPSILRRKDPKAENPIRAIRDDLRKRIADALGLPGKLTGAPRPKPEPEPAPRRLSVKVAADARPDPDCDRPCSEAAKSQRRVQVSFRVTTRDFMRLQLAAAELGRPSQDLIIEAVDQLLDEHGVERFEDCACLARAAERADYEHRALHEVLSGEDDL